MFQFELLTKRDWALVAMTVALMALIAGVWVHWLVN
jgi:hypothetical protein